MSLVQAPALASTSLTPPAIRWDASGLILTSHSIDNLFDFCPRKFEFAHVRENRPIGNQSGFAAEVGTSIHLGVQAWLIARHEGESETRARELGAYAFMRSYPWAGDRLQYTKVRDFEYAALLLTMCWDDEFWGEWELVKVRVKGEERWAVEVPFVIVHTSMGLMPDGRYLATQGTIDLILKHKTTGQIASTDIKTTIYEKMLTDSQFKFSGQQVGYGQVVEAMLGRPIDSLKVYYFIARFNADIPEIQVKPYEKTRADLEDYWLDKFDRLNDIKRSLIRGRFRRTNGGCHSYGYVCDFFSVCESRDPDFIDDWFKGASQKRELPDWWVRLET